MIAAMIYKDLRTGKRLWLVFLCRMHCVISKKVITFVPYVQPVNVRTGALCYIQLSVSNCSVNYVQAINASTRSIGEPIIGPH